MHVVHQHAAHITLSKRALRVYTVRPVPAWSDERPLLCTASKPSCSHRRDEASFSSIAWDCHDTFRLRPLLLQ